MLKTLSLLLIILLGGCMNKELISKQNQESAFIVIKTPKMKYADLGFIYKKEDLVKVEIYALGQAQFTIDINGMNVCMSTFECMSKADFNAKFLSRYYPDTLLERIFSAKPIFNQEGLTQTDDGFIQKIQKENTYNISYLVTSNQQSFRDTINKILIKVKKK
jgi:hypothetical protein